MPISNNVWIFLSRLRNEPCDNRPIAFRFYASDSLSSTCYSYYLLSLASILFFQLSWQSILQKHMEKKLVSEFQRFSLRRSYIWYLHFLMRNILIHKNKRGQTTSFIYNLTLFIINSFLRIVSILKRIS